MPEKKQERFIWVLAIGGYIPFIGLAALSYLGLDLPLPYPIATYFLTWSLAILTFLGGIRWGIAIRKNPVDMRAVVLSVVPCIIGWFALFMPEGVAVIVLGTLFAIHGFWDYVSFRKDELEWFVPIRLTLTILVCFTHFLVLSIFF